MIEEMFLTVGEVANLLKVSIRQVHRLSKNGAIPKPLKIGGSSRWLLTQLMESITNGDI
jgi:predicted DNA-binding transcriptional regulator AlpA